MFNQLISARPLQYVKLTTRHNRALWNLISVDENK